MAYNLSVAPCGQECADCKDSDQCPGCRAHGGKPRWSRKLIPAICPVFNCCANDKHQALCSRCREYPCRTYLALRDPAQRHADVNRRGVIRAACACSAAEIRLDTAPAAPSRAPDLSDLP